MQQVKRPLVHIVFYWTLGLIGGSLYVKSIQGWPLFCITVGCIMLGTYYYFGKKQLGVCCISLLIGMLLLVNHPTTREMGKFQESHQVNLKGTVQEIQEMEYGQTIVLKNVVLMPKNQALCSKVQVNLKGSLSQSIYIGERLQIEGKVTAFPTAMNPSDFDYGQYLKGKNVVGVIKGTAEPLGGHKSWLISIKEMLIEDLQTIFKAADEGIMQAALLGDDEALIEETRALYSAAGIGHILCVSGFHVALVVSFLLGFCSLIGLSYNKRYIVSIIGVWLYAILTGLSTSTVRASIMAMLIMVARIIWAEEDFWTSIALSMLLILIWRPYSLFNMGFQLSFAAVGAIGISQIYLKKWLVEVKGIKKKLLQMTIPWLIITLITSPIIAFHYYEIPFLSGILNLCILPLFSGLIILGWLALGIYLISGMCIWPLVKGMVVLLQGIEGLCKVMITVPFGTICTGKPTMAILISYYGILVLLGLRVYGIQIKKQVILAVGSSLILGGVISCFAMPCLQIAYLYVGQGDGIVVITPHKQVAVIDGGPFGKGKVVAQYIKYKGKQAVDAIIISHSDSDHIGGMIDLIESNLKIKHAFISEMDTSENLEVFMAACHKKQIPVHKLVAGDKFLLDDINFNVLAPKINQGDLNNNSLVFLVKYKQFKALFTGDKEKESETGIYNGIAPISVLKISHHGSKTGTDENLLLKLRPQYAMISCGINNLYKHPHKEVLTSLNNCHIPYSRTDLQGAAWITSDGEKMNLYTQKQQKREEE